MTATALEDKLYSTLLESPLQTIGATQTLPALKDLLLEMRKDKFWDGARPRRLAEKQMIRTSASATYRRDLRELRDRILKNRHDSDLLSWLVMFVIEHYGELARTSTLFEPKFHLAYEMTWLNLTPEEALANRDDWQAWIVEWLRDALRDEDLDAGPTSTDGSNGGSDDDGDAMPELRPSSKPSPGSDPELEF